jgi:hypothetical protein
MRYRYNLFDGTRRQPTKRKKRCEMPDYTTLDLVRRRQVFAERNAELHARRREAERQRRRLLFGRFARREAS